jgi:hypothetical protein
MAIGGGFHALRSVMYYAWQIGPFKLWQSLNSKNACKACAFGTGGQNGGLKNEAARSFEVCNKNITNPHQPDGGVKRQANGGFRPPHLAVV